MRSRNARDDLEVLNLPGKNAIFFGEQRPEVLMTMLYAHLQGAIDVLTALEDMTLSGPEAIGRFLHGGVYANCAIQEAIESDRVAELMRRLHALYPHLSEWHLQLSFPPGGMRADLIRKALRKRRSGEQAGQFERAVSTARSFSD